MRPGYSPSVTVGQLSAAVCSGWADNRVSPKDVRVSWVFVNNYLATNTSVMTFFYHKREE